MLDQSPHSALSTPHFPSSHLVLQDLTHLNLRQEDVNNIPRSDRGIILHIRNQSPGLIEPVRNITRRWHQQRAEAVQGAHIILLTLPDGGAAKIIGCTSFATGQEEEEHLHHVGREIGRWSAGIQHNKKMTLDQEKISPLALPIICT